EGVDGRAKPGYDDLSNSRLPLRRHARLYAGHPRLRSGFAVKTWMAGQSPAMTAEMLIHGNAACLDRSGPFLDFALDEFLQIVRRSARLGGKVGADLAHAQLHRRRIDGRERGRMQLLDDRMRRAFRQEQSKPVRGVEIAQALLVRGCLIGQARRAISREDCGRLDSAACSIGDSSVSVRE